ncbi:ATP-binding cassette domain-containing protein [candidate division WOR-3 bacterium]|nr:ATP-binding cassette domain-containing protein [candidate division WOR-3 bacterium]
MILENVIESKNLKKTYGDFTAVDCISFSVFRGEIFGFLGPNGAGKTTTINMLTGMARISGGQIFYFGENMPIKKAQALIGVVPDESNLYEEMNGFENLCFCGALYGMAKKDREKRAGLLLDLLGLKEAAGKKYKAYSKGMKRKLTIAAALVHSPKILYLDEPTTGIDVASVRQIRNMIKFLNQEGTTIFLTTHYIEEAERLCDRIAFIVEGRIIRIGTVEELIEGTKETNSVEIFFDKRKNDSIVILQKLEAAFPSVQCLLENDNSVKISSPEKIDIAPFVGFLSSEGLWISEAKLLKPSLEEAFVKITGIEIEKMKKEKEKK